MNSWSRKVSAALGLAMWMSIGFMGSPTLRAGSTEPFIYSTELKGEQVVISVHVPAGHMSTILEISNDVASGWQPIVAGKLSGEESLVTFTFPDNQPIRFMRVKAGPSAELPKVRFLKRNISRLNPASTCSPSTKTAKYPRSG